MSEIAPPIERSEPGEDLGRSLSISAGNLFEPVWHFFISMRTGLALILGLAALALVGTLLVQAPAGMQRDPQAYAAWLDSVRPKYGGWTGVFDVLGFFSVFNSLWFKLAVALLVTSLVACSVNRTPILWRQATRPRIRMSETFFERAPLHATLDAAAGEDAALDRLTRTFLRNRYRIAVDREGGQIQVYADRFRWAPFGTVIAHLSLVLVLIGVVLGTSLGFRNPDFAVPIGTRVDVGNGTELTIEATSFSDSYNAEDGAPSDYASDLVLYKGGQQVAAQTIRVNQPLHYGDVTFYQSFFGPAATMQIKDAKGAVLFDGGVPLLWGSKDGTERVGQLSLADQGLTAYVVGAASGQVSNEIKAGQMRVELYRAGTTAPVDVKVLDQGKVATVGGLEFTFVRERQFTGLIVARDPGVLFVWGGAILLVAGVCLVFFFPNRRAWARIRRRDDGTISVQVAAIVRHDASLEIDFHKFIAGLRLALDGRSAS